MLKQFNLNELRFDDPALTTDEEGQPIATTHGAGWYALTDPAHIEGINTSITGGGEVWLEDGQLHYSGAMPSPYHIFDRKAQRWRLPNEVERLTERQAYIERLKVLKRNEINDQAQAFVNATAKLDQTPDFERATWQEQANESVAWHADNRTPTPTLDTIAQNRGIPVDILRQKAYEKTMAFRHLTNTIAGQRQHFEDMLEQADTPEAIDNIVVRYHINPEAESNE